MHRSIYNENDQSGLQGMKLRKTSLLEHKYREMFVLLLDVTCTLLVKLNNNTNHLTWKEGKSTLSYLSTLKGILYGFVSETVILELHSLGFSKQIHAYFAQVNNLVTSTLWTYFSVPQLSF